jgi:uncharacterized protein YdeI (YjbR/CyaY-like superfamily)
MNNVATVAFSTPRELEKWLKQNHETQTELWVRIFKKGSGTATVTWDDCVVACIAWGWIDSQRKALDEVSFLQRLTPRRAKSNWSQRNRDVAERLIAAGSMQPAGLAHVEAARQDGRWEKAYAGSATMVIPDDFLKALRKVPAAQRFYETLDRRNLFAIYHRLYTAKRPETRDTRIKAIIAQLAGGETFY